MPVPGRHCVDDHQHTRVCCQSALGSRASLDDTQYQVEERGQSLQPLTSAMGPPAASSSIGKRSNDRPMRSIDQTANAPTQRSTGSFIRPRPKTQRAGYNDFALHSKQIHKSRLPCTHMPIRAQIERSLTSTAHLLVLEGIMHQEPTHALGHHPRCLIDATSG